jgi:hypothetical protein
MFYGKDYHRRFERAWDELAGRVLDRDEVLAQLLGIERTLWKAIRCASLVASSLATTVVVTPFSYLAGQSGDVRWIDIAIVTLDV